MNPGPSSDTASACSRLNLMDSSGICAIYIIRQIRPHATRNHAVCFDNIRSYEREENGPSLEEEQECSHTGLSQKEPKPGFAGGLADGGFHTNGTLAGKD